MKTIHCRPAGGAIYGDCHAPSAPAMTGGEAVLNTVVIVSKAKQSSFAVVGKSAPFEKHRQ
ncbi:MAG: hypothetical protein LBF61_07890 [Azoarcus sp.]|jgi:hypothetical protein|nr:hypothetical protein [Azoarcus sp.]